MSGTRSGTFLLDKGPPASVRVLEPLEPHCPYACHVAVTIIYKLLCYLSLSSLLMPIYRLTVDN